MALTIRQSGLLLTLAGTAAAATFWAFDPAWGIAPKLGTAAETLDEAQFGTMTTIVGLAGASIVVVLGLYLSTRKAV